MSTDASAELQNSARSVHDSPPKNTISDRRFAVDRRGRRYAYFECLACGADSTDRAALTDFGCWCTEA